MDQGKLFDFHVSCLRGHFGRVLVGDELRKDNILG